MPITNTFGISRKANNIILLASRFMNSLKTAAVILLLGMVQPIHAQTQKAKYPAKRSTAPTNKAATKKPMHKAKVAIPANKPPADVSKTAKPIQQPPPTPPAPPQDINPISSKDQPIEFEAGFTLALPVRTFHLFQRFGFGVDGAAHYRLPDKLKDLSVGIRINYSYFLAKPASTFFKSESASLVNLLADAEYKLPYHFFAGAGLGVGVALRSSGSSVGFAKAIYAGYAVELPDNSLLFSLFFGQSMSGTKNLGVRAAIQL